MSIMPSRGASLTIIGMTARLIIVAAAIRNKKFIKSKAAASASASG